MKELNARGWRDQALDHAARERRAAAGRSTRTALYQLLTNVAYIGKVRYKDEVHDGEHEAIVDAETCLARSRRCLQRNGRSGGRAARNKHGALLRGLLRCAACDCGMSHTYTAKGSRQYRYYVCSAGPAARLAGQCPSPSIPAGEIERFVVDQIKCDRPRPARGPRDVGRRPGARPKDRWRTPDRRNGPACGHVNASDHAELGRLAAVADVRRSGLAADAQDRIRDAERRLTEIDDELATLERRPGRRGRSGRRPGRLRRRVGLPGPARTGPGHRAAGRAGRLRRRTTGASRSPSARPASRRWPANWPNERRSAA